MEKPGRGGLTFQSRFGGCGFVWGTEDRSEREKRKRPGLERGQKIQQINSIKKREAGLRKGKKDRWQSHKKKVH